MSDEVSNEMRADRARKTLDAYAKIRNADNNDFEANIIGLLTDLRHELARWGELETICLERCMSMSQVHFEAGHNGVQS